MPPKARRYCLNHGLFGNPQMFAGGLDTSRHSKPQLTTEKPRARIVLRKKISTYSCIFPCPNTAFAPDTGLHSLLPALNIEVLIVQLCYLAHEEWG